MRGSSARGRIARLLALLLLLQGLPGAFPRLSVTAAGAFEICSGADPRRLAPPPGDVPDLPEKASCIACLLPAPRSPRPSPRPFRYRPTGHTPVCDASRLPSDR